MIIVSAQQRDLNWLDAALQRVVAAQHGPTALRRLNRLLDASRQAGSTETQTTLARQLGRLSDDQLRVAVRYCAVRLDMMNLAEDRQRLRILLHRQRTAAAGPRSGSIARAMDAWERRHKGRSRRRIAGHLMVDLVLTAHPTDAKRRTIRHSLKRIRQLLAAFDQPDLPPQRLATLETRLDAVLTAIWQTDLIRPIPPTVRQEIQRGLHVARRLWPLAARIDRDLCAAAGVLPTPAQPAALRFGSWIGGDRDGHPFVTARETAYALRASHRLALRLHLRTIGHILPGLSLSTRKQSVDAQLNRHIAVAVQRWPGLGAKVEREPQTELYRRLGRIIQWRLRQTLQRTPGAYAGPQELLDDVWTMYHSLGAHQAQLVAADVLADWISQIRVFGFHMLALDVRQDSRVYAEVIGELMARAGGTEPYAQADEAARRRLLHQTLGRLDAGKLRRLSPVTRDTLDLFALLRRTLVHQPQALGGHVISMTHQVSDVLAVPWLLAVGAKSGGAAPTLPAVPLFETIDDLQRCAGVLEELFTDPVYRRLLQRQHNRQMVMIGYSDSTKDGGYLAACWMMYQAQIAMHRVARRHGVELTFFHGRGGSLGRGGGPAARAIQSLPAHTVNGRIRITEQGEVLVERYDNPQIGYRHLEQVVASTLSTIGGGDQSVPAAWQDVLARAADEARRVYRELVEHPAFMDYFRSATPIDEIEQLQIGSRPARRRGQKSLADLRAIPWVFSWTQSRHMIPAWYGLGSMLPGLAQRRRLNLLRRMYRDWNYFRTIIDNAALAFAKFEPDIIHHYAQLAPPHARPLSTHIIEEAQRAAQVIKTIVGVPRILADVPWLQEAVAMRNPWIAVLNLSQIALLRRLRNPDQADHVDAARELLRKTIYGVSCGLRTTG